MVVVFILFIILLLSIIRNKDWTNPATLMCSLWFAIMLAYEIDLIPLYRISPYTYVVICIGVIAFMLGTNFVDSSKITFHNSLSLNEYLPRYGLILLLSIVSFILYLPDAFFGLSVIMRGGDFVEIRGGVSDTVITNSLLNLILNYIVRPFVILLYPTAGYCLLTLKNSSKQVRMIKKWIFIFAVLISVLQMFTSGGRASLVYLIVHIVILSHIMKEKVYVSKTIKLIIGITIIAVAAAVYYVSLSRGIEDVGESLVYYFNGCVPLLDHHLTETMRNDAYTYGGAFFFGPLQLVFTLLGNLGIPEPDFLFGLEKALYVEENIQVGPTIKMNAFVSWFYYLYKDGGLVFLIVEAIIYGAICSNFYRRAVSERNNVRKIVGYSIITNTILFSMVRFQLISYHYLLSFIFITLLFKRCSKKKVLV